jgi:hypothetical protein
VFLEQNKPAIDGILKDFGVPLLPLQAPAADRSGASR